MLNVGRGYSPRFKGAKSTDQVSDDVPINIRLAGSYPGETQTEVPFPEPKEISYEESFLGVNYSNQIIRIVDLHNLVNLKLVSSKSLPRERILDYTGVRMLIQSNPLDAGNFAERLDPSVHKLYIGRLLKHYSDKSSRTLDTVFVVVASWCLRVVIYRIQP